VEEELQVIDPQTFELRSHVAGIFAEGRHELQDRLKPEMHQPVVELGTAVFHDIHDVRREVIGLRRSIVELARRNGMRVAAAGTHPFSPIEEQRYTARHRYRELVAALRYAARRVAVFGMHVHVAVDGVDKGIQIVEALLPELPLLLALSASSPFLAGDETGLASTRIVLGQSMPRTGLPPAFESYAEYAGSLEQLRHAGALEDSTYVWWDARLHPTFGTIEVRIMDVQPSVQHAGAIAGLIQSLVRHLGQRYDRGGGFPRANRLIVGENRWLAARYGLRARLVRPGEDPRSARDLVLALVERLEDDANAVGAGWALERIAGIAAEGSSAELQLARYRRGTPLDAILLDLVAETGMSA
jgi:carboxylate-amine ligase